MRVLGQKSRMSLTSFTHKFTCSLTQLCIPMFRPKSSIFLRNHMFQHFPIFDLAIKKRRRSTKGHDHHLYNHGSTLASSDTYQVPMPSLNWFPPGCVAQSVGHLTRTSGVLGSIPGLATYFRFSFRFFKKGSCQLLAGLDKSNFHLLVR